MSNPSLSSHIIKSKDLNLLRVFGLLLQEGNLSRVAAIMGLTQPAVSRSLMKLREEFGDPMFVRGPGGVLPTAKALSLEAPLREVLERLEVLYAKPKPFSPATATGVIRIATNDYFEQVVWSEHLGAILQEAPKLTMVTMTTGSKVPEVELRNGELQLAIAGYFDELPSGFMRQKILTDRFVTVARRDHPVVKKKLTLEMFVKTPQLIVSTRGDLDGAVDVALRKIGKKRHIAASVCSFFSCGPVVAHSDLLLTLPERLVKKFANDLPIQVFETPLDMTPLNVVQVWHERYQNDQLHMWLRTLIGKVAGG